MRSSFLLLSLASISLAATQKQDILKDDSAGPLNREFSHLVKETLNLWQVPGLAIAVIDGDDVYAEGYGIATFPDTKATPETLWYAGSTTKAFTASVMSLLVDDNKNFSQVQWDTPISALIRDDFVLENEYATNHITVEDALSHRTGMPRHEISYGGFYDGHKATPRDIVRALRHLALTAEPRTTYQYCNMMYVTVAYVIEFLTGRWLGDLIAEKIWKPLGMHSTYFSTPAAQASPEHLAQGYVYYNDKYQEVPFMDLEVVSGAGSVISNVLDYSKWLKAFMNGTSLPLSASSYNNLKAGRILTPEPENGWAYTGPVAYSLGWITGNYKGYEFFQHSGGMEAFGTEVIIFPAQKYGIVTFGNTAMTSNWAEEKLLWHLIDEKLEIPESERFDWNKKNKDAMNQETETYKNATSIYYPTIPSPTLPLTLPLSYYTGTYNHPSYQNMTFILNPNNKNGKETLHANRQDATWKLELDLEHVSGDYFMAKLDSTTAPGFPFREALAAEFRVDARGRVLAFGMAAEPEMGIEGRIWFERV